jgi:hypothetical protein
VVSESEGGGGATGGGRCGEWAGPGKEEAIDRVTQRKIKPSMGSRG